MRRNEDEVTDEHPENEPKQELATRQEVKREIVEFVKLVAWFLILFIALKTYVIEGYEVQGPSMIPTLRDQERILVLKLPYILSNFSIAGSYDPVDGGDIIVF